MKRRFLQELIAREADTRCAADLLRYFLRHPSAYVTTAQLASSVGYGPDDIEAGISTLMRGGLLVQRRQVSVTAGLYHLVREEWLSELARATSSSAGRRHLRQLLRAHELRRRAAATNRRARAQLHRSDRILRIVQMRAEYRRA